jgi:hypothetical protein
MLNDFDRRVLPPHQVVKWPDLVFAQLARHDVISLGHFIIIIIFTSMIAVLISVDLT